jgi:DNA processing protein
MISEEDRIQCIRLIRSENVGPRSFQTLVEIYGSAEKALEVLPKMARKGGKKGPLKIVSYEEAAEELESTIKKGARIITIFDEEYPKILTHIKDFPPCLTLLGRGEMLDKHAVAIVGARNASANGCRFAEDVAREIGHSGLAVVSGLARGIDTVAHKATLATGTIAVVAGGIDKIYPPENKDLFFRIAEKGLIIAEMPVGAVPKAQYFPRRNRIIAGLSLGTVVVEASLNSGSLITARFALEQNREVFAVPGSPLDPRCAGTNSLIQKGAHVVTKPADVLFEINLFKKASTKMLESEVKYKPMDINVMSDDDLEKARPLIYEKLSTSPTLVDDIIGQTGIPAHIVLNVLLELELAGRLERYYGNKVSIVYLNEELFAESA